MQRYKADEKLLRRVRTASEQELVILAGEIRKKITEVVSKNGGHLASNLGVVELTLALHRVFNTPEDKVVWDVGHQCYAHKLITGRWDAFESLRTHGGISGFPKRAESEFDAYDSGHSGTSISAAFGYAKARDLKNEKYSCVAVIGDGALTGGVSFEALNAAGSDGTPLIVILNDNGMSIAKNVGGMSRQLQKIRTSNAYLEFKNSVRHALDEDSRILSTLRGFRDTLKFMTMPGEIFEELGFKYFGPVNGHDFSELIPALNTAKELGRPVLVHVVTEKGKGYAPAEKDPSRFHGTGPFEIDSPETASVSGRESWSDAFGRLLLDRADKDGRIAAVTAAMAEGTGLTAMQKKYPGRVFDAGIAEQHAVSFAAGLALGGIRPVFAVYSTFLQRAYDQILTEVCLQGLPVIFAIDRAGITGRDGETHQGQFDIAYLSSMPNMTVLSPRDADELGDMLDYALALGSPCAIRYPKGSVPSFPEHKHAPFRPLPEFLVNGSDILLLSDGNSLSETLLASALLKTAGVSAGVCNMRCLKPMSKEGLEAMMLRYGVIATIEDGTVEGGFGEKVSAFAAELGRGTLVLNIGWPDRFIEHGDVSALRRLYGLDARSIAERIELFIEKKAR